VASIYYAPSPRVGALSDDARLTSVCLTSDVCLSVAYIRLKSRTERPRKTEIGTEVAHLIRYSDTTFKVKRSKVNLQGAGAYCGGLPHSVFPLRSLRITVVEDFCIRSRNIVLEICYKPICKQQSVLWRQRQYAELT